MRHNKAQYHGTSPVVCTTTTHPPNPAYGQKIIETDTGNVLIYYGATTQWTPEWNQAWGQVARTEITADVTFTSAGADFASASWQAYKNRRYKATAWFPRWATVAANSKFDYVDGSNAIIAGNAGINTLPVTGEPSRIYLFCEDFSGANGTVIRKCRVTSATASANTIGCTGSKGYWLIEDIGSFGPPA